MIPERLKLNNFLPYRGDIAPFSFDGIHLACISGDNGAGKTSIIDAMTWALWGKSRAGSKATGDDELITQGEREMSVTFDFRTGDGQVYRVERRRTKPKKGTGAGQSVLKLFTVTDGQVSADISGSTIAETGDIIRGLVGLDYDTFINSAYLKQGEADHFTELPPTRRKEVLGSILNLEIYDRLADSAKEKANQASASMKMISDSIGFDRTRLEEESSINDSLKQAEADLKNAKSDMEENRARLEDLRKQYQVVQSNRQLAIQAENAVKEIEADISVRQSELKETEDRLSRLREIISKKETIESGFAELLKVKVLNDDYNRRLVETRRLELEAGTVREAIDKAGRELEKKRANWQAAYDQIRDKAARLDDLKESLKALKPALDALSAKENLRTALREALHRESLASSGYDAELKALHNRIDELDKRSRMLTADEAVCPVCTTELSSKKRQAVIDNYHREESELREKITEARRAKETSEKRSQEIQRELDDIGDLEAERRKLTADETRLDTAIEEARSSADRLSNGQRELTEINRIIENREYAPEEHRRLAELQASLEKLSYDTEKHDNAAKQLSLLQNFEKEHAELTHAASQCVADESAATRIQSAVSQLRDRLSVRKAEAEKCRKQLDSLPDINEAQINEQDTKFRRASERVSAVNERIGRLKQELAQLEQVRKQIADKEKEIRQLAESEELYRELHTQFGRNGIQASLIEDAVPEIEAEANALLGRMTDNRMSLKLELQRMTRKGEPTETFDIKVSDELGTRDYELFSGGEAFRINFALRLALSRLLAHRTGAPLRTLIIDEGFGTQDAAGIDKLKAAISNIQDQFDCVLVITHIEEFKDAFPARIEVFKTAEGSNIRVMYN